MTNSSSQNYAFITKMFTVILSFSHSCQNLFSILSILRFLFILHTNRSYPCLPSYCSFLNLPPPHPLLREGISYWLPLYGFYKCIDFPVKRQRLFSWLLLGFIWIYFIDFFTWNLVFESIYFILTLHIIVALFTFLLSLQTLPFPPPNSPSNSWLLHQWIVTAFTYKYVHK